MNNWEREYARMLENQKIGGAIADWRYEPFRLILAPRTSYTPDFLVIHLNGSVEIIEVKGQRRDDALVKYKVAAAMFPWWIFSMVTRKKGLWSVIESMSFNTSWVPTAPDEPIPDLLSSSPKKQRVVPALSYSQMMADPDLKRYLQMKPEQLREIRIRACLSLPDMADAIGVTPAAWQSLESGKTKIYHHRHVLALRKMEESL